MNINVLQFLLTYLILLSKIAISIGRRNIFIIVEKEKERKKEKKLFNHVLLESVPW